MTPCLAHVGGGTLEPLQLLAVDAGRATPTRCRARTLAGRGSARCPAWRVACFAAGMLS